MKAWRVFADGADRIAETVGKDTGLSCIYHPHGSTWVEAPDEVERLELDGIIDCRTLSRHGAYPVRKEIPVQVMPE